MPFLNARPSNGIRKGDEARKSRNVSHLQGYQRDEHRRRDGDKAVQAWRNGVKPFAVRPQARRRSREVARVDRCEACRAPARSGGASGGETARETASGGCGLRVRSRRQIRHRRHLPLARPDDVRPIARRRVVRESGVRDACPRPARAGMVGLVRRGNRTIGEVSRASACRRGRPCASG